MAMQIRIGVIGAGARAGHVVKFASPDVDATIGVAEIADVDPRRAAQFKTIYNTSDAAIYDDCRRMLDEVQLDAVIIATPNNQHADQAIAVMERGLPLFLEKPVATSLHDCRRLLDVQARTQARVTVGFVLRYTPFYCKLRETIKSGVIGEIMSINAEELMSRGLTAAYFRGWRANYETSGSLLLEKCCHDIDILNWLMDGLPQSISSFGSRVRVFGPKSQAAARCRDCAIAAECYYNYWYFDSKCSPDGSDAATAQQIRYGLVDADTCVYGNPNFNLGLESQSVSMLYDGIPVHFSLVMGQEWSHRGIHVLGSEGRIYGDPDDNSFAVFAGCRDHGNDRREVVEVRPDSSGHHGGDSVIAREFMQSAVDPAYHPKASLEDGVKSAAICLAAEKARLENRIITLGEEYEVL